MAGHLGVDRELPLFQTEPSLVVEVGEEGATSAVRVGIHLQSRLPQMLCMGNQGVVVVVMLVVGQH